VVMPPTAPNTKEEKIYTKDNCIEALQNLSKVKDINCAKKILTEFAASRVSDLQPTQYANFVCRCKEELAP
jgi:hypothetical protein